MSDCRDFATLSQVKQYLYGGIPSMSVPSSDDAILSSYLTAVSVSVARECGKIKGQANLFVAQAWVETRNGTSQTLMRLRARPIINVTAVIIGGTSLQSAQGSLVNAGFVWTSDYVDIRGGPWWGSFPPIYQSCQFQYTGGYNTPGMTVVAALPDWLASTQYAAGTQINHLATGLIYTATNGGISGSSSPAFPSTLGSQVTDGAGVSVNVASITENGTIVTVNTAMPHGLSPNQTFAMASVTLAGYNGTFIVQSTASPTQFTYVAPFAGLGPGGGGVITAPALVWQATGLALPLVAGATMIPEDLTLATIQETALVYKERTRVGDKSTSQGQSKTEYVLDGMSKGTMRLIARHVDWAGALEGAETVPAMVA
jgi:hypothetical protein